MAFTYNFGTNPPIDYPRLLVSDTVQLNPDGSRQYVFEDTEITAAAAIASLQWQSSMFFSGTQGTLQFPVPPTNYLRTAATLLMALSSNSARLAMIKQILDVRVDATDAAEQMRKTAQSYLEMDDNSGAFAIVEQVTTVFSFKDRFWKQVQRQTAAGGLPV